MLSPEEAKTLAFQLKISAEYWESVHKIHSTILTGKTDINLKDIGNNYFYLQKLENNTFV